MLSMFKIETSNNYQSTNGALALFTSLLGLAAGIGVTATIAKLYNDSIKETERKKRNVIAATELRGDDYDLIETFIEQITPLCDAIKKYYPDKDSQNSNKAEQFLEAVKLYALPTKDEVETNLAGGTVMMCVPDLAAGLRLKVKRKEGSGVEEEIVRLLQKYKIAKSVKKDGIDINVTMMQVLINIVIVYKQFIEENKILPVEMIPQESNKSDAPISKLQAVNAEMAKFIDKLTLTLMFQDRDIQILTLVKETRRQMTLPKIGAMVVDMGKEAVNYQIDASPIKRSIEKQRMIREIGEAFAEFIERTSTHEINQLSSYSPYLRSKKIVDTDIDLKNDKTSSPDDLIATIVTDHLESSYHTFHTDKIQNRVSSEFSHLNFLVDNANGNTYKPLTGKINLPLMTNVTTEKGEFSKYLSGDKLRHLAPAIKWFFKYNNIAAAMQADLTTRLCAHGWVGLSLTDELQYREKLIDVFMARSKNIARNTLLENGSYFNDYIQRTTNTEFMHAAMNDDRWKSGTRIIEADKGKYTTNKLDTTFNVPLDHTLHATALRTASEKMGDISLIDEEFKKLQGTASRVADEQNIKIISPGSMNKEFLYNIALCCQDDVELQKSILNIKTDKLDDKQILDGYITELADLKSEIRNVFQACEDATQLGTIHEVRLNNVDFKLGDTAYKFDRYTYNQFVDFIRARIKISDGSIEINGKPFARGINFQNKASILELRSSIRQLERELNHEFAKSLEFEKQHATKIKSGLGLFIGKLDSIINGMDHFNKGVTTPAEFGQLEREKLERRFEQNINEIQARQQIQTENLMDRIAKIKGEQQEAITTLFKNNNAAMTKLIDTLKTTTDAYANVLVESGKDVGDTISSCFKPIEENIAKLAEKQQHIFSLVDNALGNAKQSNEYSEKVANTNEEIIEQNYALLEILKTTVPSIISEIMLTVKSHNDKMVLTLNERNNKLTSEKEALLAQLNEANNLNISINTDMENIKNDNKETILKLQQVESDLAAQKNIIAAVDEKLVILNDTINNIILQVSDEDLENKITAIADDLKTLKTSASVEFSVKNGEIINRMTQNYAKSAAFIKTANKMLSDAALQIDDIIQANKGVTEHNENAGNKVKSAIQTLENEKQRIKKLKKDIALYRGLYEQARDNYMHSLEEQKNQNQSHLQDIKGLTEQLNNITAKQVNTLSQEVESLMSKNNQLAQQHLEDQLKIQALNHQNNLLAIEAENAKLQSAAAIQSLADEAAAQKQAMRFQLEGRFNDAITQFNTSSNLIFTVLHEAISRLETNKHTCYTHIANIDHELDLICADMGMMNRSDEALSPINGVDNELSALKESCTLLVGNINRGYKERLRKEWFVNINDPKDTGYQKIEWMDKLQTRLEHAETNEDFYNAFNELLIVYLQNKDGNGFFNLKKTTIGHEVVRLLNTQAFENIKRITFGIPNGTDITYEQLAGKLLSINSAVKDNAEATINSNRIHTKEKMELTIEQFSFVRNNHATLNLLLQKQEDLKKTTQMDGMLEQKIELRHQLQQQINKVEKIKQINVPAATSEELMKQTLKIVNMHSFFNPRRNEEMATKPVVENNNVKFDTI